MKSITHIQNIYIIKKIDCGKINKIQKSSVIFWGKHFKWETKEKLEFSQLSLLISTVI